MSEGMIRRVDDKSITEYWERIDVILISRRVVQRELVLPVAESLLAWEYS